MTTARSVLARKWRDFELIGNPLGVIIAKGLQKGEVEIIVREGLKKETFALASGDLVERLAQMLSEMK